MAGVAVTDLDEIEREWEPAGYHGFSTDGMLFTAITSAGQVLSADSPAALDRTVRQHWLDWQ